MSLVLLLDKLPVLNPLGHASHSPAVHWGSACQATGLRAKARSLPSPSSSRTNNRATLMHVSTDAAQRPQGAPAHAMQGCAGGPAPQIGKDNVGRSDEGKKRCALGESARTGRRLQTCGRQDRWWRRRAAEWVTAPVTAAPSGQAKLISG